MRLFGFHERGQLVVANKDTKVSFCLVHCDYNATNVLNLEGRDGITPPRRFKQLHVAVDSHASYL